MGSVLPKGIHACSHYYILGGGAAQSIRKVTGFPARSLATNYCVILGDYLTSPSLYHFIFKVRKIILPCLSSMVEDSINTCCCIPRGPLLLNKVPCPSLQGQEGEVGWRRVAGKGGLKLSLEVICLIFKFHICLCVTVWRNMDPRV